MTSPSEFGLGAAHIPILDHGYVEYVESWGSDERIIEAARMSTGKGFQGWEKDEKLLRYLWENKHMTPFEMCGAIFEIKAPIFVFREWHRHRTQSYNEMSARYMPLPDENYVPDLEDLVKRSEEAANTKNRQASGSGKVISESQAKLDLNALRDIYSSSQMIYKMFLEHGWPKELARLVVPVGRYSKMRASANLRNWLQFLELRRTPQAQKDTRLYADAISSILSNLFPRTMVLYEASHSQVA